MFEDEPDIVVEAEPEYLPSRSNIMNDVYAFSYRITIRNEGEEPAILRRRYWLITNAKGEVQEVSGPGVVGEEPLLLPGDEFEYTSGATVTTPWASMEGHYEFELSDGSFFKVDIPLFHLKAEITLQ
ncbi:Co2+/Mg2+ efflux protein ApaG [Neisseriaceae bacterium CLB008]|nr:Co2+/Mg2+ efflux protein ApaG [Neisseriaceae bacterium]